MKEEKNNIAILRLGALGDVLCSLSLHREIKEKYGELYYYTHSSTIKALGPFIKEYGLVDDLIDCETSLLDTNNHNYHKLIAYPISKGYPFKIPMQNHLKRYMERELKIDKKYDFFLQSKPINFHPWRQGKKFITIQTKCGWSRYKEWPITKWEELIKIIKKNSALKIHQIGAANDPVPKGVDLKFDGFSTCVNEQCWAEAHIGLDSIFNHTSDILWSHKAKRTPAVIIFGSTCPTGFGYEGNENIFLDKSCQPCYKENIEIVNALNRSSCNNGHCCMMEITPQMVWERLEKIL